jgi:hypothetical protein
MRPGPLSFTPEREQRESNRQGRNTASRSTDGPGAGETGPGSAEAPRTSLMIPGTLRWSQGENESIKTNVQRCVPMRCMPIRDTHP